MINHKLRRERNKHLARFGQRLKIHTRGEISYKYVSIFFFDTHKYISIQPYKLYTDTYSTVIFVASQGAKNTYFLCPTEYIYSRLRFSLETNRSTLIFSDPDESEKQIDSGFWKLSFLANLTLMMCFVLQFSVFTQVQFLC